MALIISFIYDGIVYGQRIRDCVEECVEWSKTEERGRRWPEEGRGQTPVGSVEVRD